MNLFSIQKNRTFSISLTTLSLLCCIPQGVCYANDLGNEILVLHKIQQTKPDDTEMLIQDLVESARSVSDKEDPIVAARQLLKDLTNQINIQCSQNLSLSDMCRLVRENFNLFQIPAEEQPALLIALELIELESETFQSGMALLTPMCIFPYYTDTSLTSWDWLFFYFEKKQEKKDRIKKERQLKQRLETLAAVSIGVKEFTVVVLIIGLGIAAIYMYPTATSEIVTTVTGAVVKIVNN